MKNIFLFFSIIFITQAKAQSCGSGGCAAADTNATGRYPSGIFSTISSTWSTVSPYMNAGNYTLFDVTLGQVYEWTYCSDFGGSQSWDAELTLFNNANGTALCYQNNCGRSNCTSAPYIRWTATFTGTVKLLTTVSGCLTNTGSPYSKLVWRDTTGTPLVQVLGVDVYSGNGTINWSQVLAAGYKFAWAKATEGIGYTDSEYLNYATNGVNAGIKMGAYHFARPDLNPTNAGAIAEANYFLSVAQPYIISCELPPSLDLEGSYLQTNFTSTQLTAWVQNWMTTVQNATGITPVLYISSSSANFLNSSLNVYPLWTDYLDNSSTTPPPNIGVWNTWAFKQYDWTGTVAGIAGNQTDLNVFNGNITAFNNLMGCSVTDVKQNDFDNSFLIYPNPSNGIFTVSIGEIQGSQLEIYNLLGEIIYTSLLNSSKTKIDLTGNPNGIYFVKVIDEKGNFSVKKIILE